MFTRVLLITLTLLILFLSGGCRAAHPSPTPVPPSISPSVLPTAALTPMAQPARVSVPRGKPPVVDGTLSPGEWGSAVIETFSDGSELLLVRDEGYLYLGIRANTQEMIVGNVFIERGDEIVILHSSAALGTAAYQKEVDRWQQTRGFVWRCRDAGDSQAARAERAAFLGEERWLADNSQMGAPNELEFQIEMANETQRMAVNFVRASNPNVKIPWPNDLDDDCIKPTIGGMPAQLHFSLHKWATIDMSSPDSGIRNA